MKRIRFPAARIQDGRDPPLHWVLDIVTDDEATVRRNRCPPGGMVADLPWGASIYRSPPQPGEASADRGVNDPGTVGGECSFLLARPILRQPPRACAVAFGQPDMKGPVGIRGRIRCSGPSPDAAGSSSTLVSCVSACHEPLVVSIDQRSGCPPASVCEITSPVGVGCSIECPAETGNGPRLPVADCHHPRL